MRDRAPRIPTRIERILDAPERALFLVPWPATARIVLAGSLGFLRQLLRARALRLNEPGDPARPSGDAISITKR